MLGHVLGENWPSDTQGALALTHTDLASLPLLVGTSPGPARALPHSAGNTWLPYPFTQASLSHHLVLSAKRAGTASFPVSCA